MKVYVVNYWVTIERIIKEYVNTKPIREEIRNFLNNGLILKVGKEKTATK